MEKLGCFVPTTPFSNANAGTCQWCFAEKDGKEYFIKRFISPTYPVNEGMLSEKTVAKKKKECAAFEEKKVRAYTAINQYSDGNAVRVEEFFRVDARYYMAMERVRGLDFSIENISQFTDAVKRKLCIVIAHALATVHQAGYVHGDIKHNNILFTTTQYGEITAKLIDYDTGFMEDTPPEDAEEVGGDSVYMAPETLTAAIGGPILLTNKLDVFALGVLFHQYFTGFLPPFDEEQYSCAGDAVRKGECITPSESLPEDMKQLLTRMLHADPNERPTAMEVYTLIIGSALQKEKPDVQKKSKKGFESVTRIKKN